MVAYSKREPTLVLRDIVESIWIQEAPKSGVPIVPICVLPTGMVEILFHYGDPYVHHEPGAVVPVPRSYVTGQRTRPVLTRPLGRIGIVIVSLYPWGISHLFDGAHELVDGFVDLAALTDSQTVENLEDQLRDPQSHGSRVRRVENFLIRLRLKRTPVCPNTFDGRGVIAASRLLSARPTESSVQDVSTTLAMSRRHFGRKFRISTGLAPKMFARIMRFQQALRCHRQARFSWADIAVSCGYSDQPHLIREMRTFSHRTPQQLDPSPGPLLETFNGPQGSLYFDTVYLTGGPTMKSPV